MRSTILCTLALLPVLAHAQANGPTAAGSPVPATLQAAVMQPVAFHGVAHSGAASPAAAPAPPAPVHDDVQFQLDSDPVATAALHSGAISNRFGSSEPEATAPKLVHMVGRILPVARLASEENNAYVAVRLKVDERGLPENLTIAHSAGTSIDEQTLAAVRQYRFQPATVDHAPVESTVIVQVKLKK